MRIRYNTYNNKNHLFYKNRQINDNLEQQTQALFKSWFVDFEPFRGGKFVDSELGMIPEGWNIQPISSIFNFQEGPGIRNWHMLIMVLNLSTLDASIMTSLIYKMPI